MQHDRVIPRDLFNEAKLLKCLGQLALLVHDGLRWPLTLEHDTDSYRGFEIVQDDADGGLYVANLHLYLGDRSVPLKSSYNSKSSYPLVSDDGQIEVFGDDGRFTAEFESYLDEISASCPP